MPDSNVHWLQPSDYPARFVRRMDPLDMARATRDQDNIRFFREVQERLRADRAAKEAKRKARNQRWQLWVAIGCYVTLILTACYFAAQLGREVFR